MLILSRNVGEMITIGEDVTVQVVEIRGGKVRLGIVAPLEVEVHRLEVKEAIEAERRAEGRGL